jgi:hypothetical protein
VYLTCIYLDILGTQRYLCIHCVHALYHSFCHVDTFYMRICIQCVELYTRIYRCLCVYIVYCCINNIVYTQVSLSALMNDALIVAKQLDFDVFNALNILGNGVFVSVCVCLCVC